MSPWAPAWARAAAPAAALAAACGSPAPDVPLAVSADLIRQFDWAEKRSSHPADAAFRLGDATIAGETRRVIEAPPATRITWTVWLPRDPVLRVWLGLADWRDAGGGAVFRIGISDHRVYEELLRRYVRPRAQADRGWIPIEIDLSGYEGPQWSLFYRPRAGPWRLVLATDPAPGGAWQPGAGRPLWGGLAIYAPEERTAGEQ